MSEKTRFCDDCGFEADEEDMRRRLDGHKNIGWICPRCQGRY